MTTRVDPTLHPTADAYNSKETTDNYIKARPSYPKEVLDYVKNELGLNKDSLVLDLAAGTGKFTQLLVEPAGFRNIVAVEPGYEFRDSCKSILESFGLGEELKFKVLDGIASNIPLEDESVDAVFIAQAFHWFDSMDSIKEISRVLKPNGIMFMVWNDLDVTNSMVKEITDVFHFKYHDGKTPQFISNRWRNVFNELSQLDPSQRSNLVNPKLISAHFSNPQLANKDLVITRVLSTSYISILPTDQKEQLLKEINQILDNHPYTKDQTSFILPYRVEIQWTRKNL